MVAVPGRLAVADQYEARRVWTWGQWELWRLRARCFDLDIYTNFLLIPIGLGRSQERTFCSRKAHSPKFHFDRFWNLLKVSGPLAP